jgi:hypothetical protein
MNIETIIIKPLALAEISRDIAQVFFAAMFVEQITRDQISWITAISGLIVSLGFWYVSLKFAKR